MRVRVDYSTLWYNDDKSLEIIQRSAEDTLLNWLRDYIRHSDVVVDGDIGHFTAELIVLVGEELEDVREKLADALTSLYSADISGARRKIIEVYGMLNVVIGLRTRGSNDAAE